MTATLTRVQPTCVQPTCVQPTCVNVPLGARAYDVLIGRGAIEEAGARLSALAPGGRVAIVTDETVGALHLPRVKGLVEEAGLAVTPVVVPPGEGSKSYAGFAAVCEAILAARIERGDLVVALGGGVVGDLAGFAAASVRRGMRLVQAPTSLLAQVDSSVGGKTGINSAQGKNLVGAFLQPVLVIADTALLDTLPEREFRAGYAELMKIGLVNDAALFDWLEGARPAIFAGHAERETAIAAAVRAKAAIVSRDETERGERALLNLGHTFAHALEHNAGYDGARLVHGEAVAIGICLAFRFSARLGLAPGDDAARVEAHLRGAGLPTRLPDVPGGAGSVADLLGAMAQDKKVERGALTFVLARGIGRSFVARGIEEHNVREFLQSEATG